MGGKTVQETIEAMFEGLGCLRSKRVMGVEYIKCPKGKLHIALDSSTCLCGWAWAARGMVMESASWADAPKKEKCKKCKGRRKAVLEYGVGRERK